MLPGKSTQDESRQREEKPQSDGQGPVDFARVVTDPNIQVRGGVMDLLYFWLVTSRVIPGSGLLRAVTSTYFGIKWRDGLSGMRTAQ